MSTAKCNCKDAYQYTDEENTTREVRTVWRNDYCALHGIKKAGEPDPEKFPRATDSYSCVPCQNHDHAHCRGRIVDISWSHNCTCGEVSSTAHREARQESYVEKAAAVIYETGEDLHSGDYFWLQTVDGSPNAASFAIARALVEKGYIR